MLTLAERTLITERLIEQWKELVEDFEVQLSLRVDTLLVLSVSDRSATRDPGTCGCAVTEGIPPEARYTLLRSLIAASDGTGPVAAGRAGNGSSGSVCSGKGG